MGLETDRSTADGRSTDRSLGDLYAHIEHPPASAGTWRSIARYTGPGFLVAVGYMDPGNWITAIEGGARYGYLLLSVVAISSFVAMLMQYLALKVGIATGKDLAQLTAEILPGWARVPAWIVGELAIIATDMAEIIGAAIALNLLFGLPLLFGAALTVADVLLLLLLLKVGFRRIEALVATLIMGILVVFAYETALASPVMSDLFGGFIPQKEVLSPGPLHLALGIIGATIMPHNLYLHSALVQTRGFNRNDPKEQAQAIKLASVDCFTQLSAAFVINCLLLIVGAAMFFGKAESLGTFQAIYDALGNSNIVGPIASPLLSTLFAAALLASGQNSTITGTIAGQVVMEGFLKIRIAPWIRRLITRLIAVVPVLIAIAYYQGNEQKIDAMLINSQVFLCLALPLTIAALVYVAAKRSFMGRFQCHPVTIGFASVCVVVLSALNLQLVWQLITGF